MNAEFTTELQQPLATVLEKNLIFVVRDRASECLVPAIVFKNPLLH
jgi:hypothetical protein